MTFSPKTHESFSRVQMEVQKAIAVDLGNSTYRQAELQKAALSREFIWVDYAARAYLALAVEHFPISTFALHPKEGLLDFHARSDLFLLPDDGSGRPTPEFKIWGAGLDARQFKSRLASLYLHGLWVAPLIDFILSGKTAPDLPVWTTGSTPEGYQVLFKKADAQRVLETLGAEKRASRGRPLKRIEAALEFLERFPDGKKPNGVPWKIIEAELGVKADTIRRGLKELLAE